MIGNTGETIKSTTATNATHSLKTSPKNLTTVTKSTKREETEATANQKTSNATTIKDTTSTKKVKPTKPSNQATIGLIRAIKTKTANKTWADKIRWGHLYIKICRASNSKWYPQCCKISKSQTFQEKDFDEGATAIFTDQALGHCRNYALPELTRLLMYNFSRFDLNNGPQGRWQGDFIEVILNNGSMIHCDLTNMGFLDSKGFELNVNKVCHLMPANQGIGLITAIVTKTDKLVGGDNRKHGNLRLAICGPKHSDCCHISDLGHADATYINRLEGKKTYVLDEYFTYRHGYGCEEFPLPSLAWFEIENWGTPFHKGEEFIEVHFNNGSKIHCDMSKSVHWHNIAPACVLKAI